MKIAVAQTHPVTGNIERNIEAHKRFIDLAVAQSAGMIIFPELSLTGYEPRLAGELATAMDDARFDDFQQLSDTHNITIGTGVPTKHEKGLYISMVIFRPNGPRSLYSKKYIHADEEEFFVSGENFPCMAVGDCTVSLAICYEISVHEHMEDAYAGGAEVYIASVAKFRGGSTDKALVRLADIAKEYALPVLMANSVGKADGAECAGKSSIWDNTGELLAQLNDSSEGILVYDTDTQEVVEQTL